MLRQLSLHQEYVISMVQDGYLLEALQYAKKHKVTNVRPALFLEVAFASNNVERLATVLRFFSDFIPGFLSSTDHNTYSQILSEMNAAAAAAAATSV
ncbi:hypothetical protein MLD38_026024 [Melastoma candidum]|uniref:Uncharacterized protein n=1 Tax=Melastoma candidum TaxID=119954 RepID=A0ACB9P0F7_9MYRT|nr:hypothetical protein MLD38_026024 [Melastoma candidum]